jgi:hypothetical protein
MLGSSRRIGVIRSYPRKSQIIRIVCSLKSMTRPGVNGPTSFILTMALLLLPSTRA